MGRATRLRAANASERACAVRITSRRPTRPGTARGDRSFSRARREGATVFPWSDAHVNAGVGTYMFRGGCLYSSGTGSSAFLTLWPRKRTVWCTVRRWEHTRACRIGHRRRSLSRVRRAVWTMKSQAKPTEPSAYYYYYYALSG